jgi:regulatory protein
VGRPPGSDDLGRPGATGVRGREPPGAIVLREALAIAHRSLGRREHTAAELRALLERRGALPEVVERALEKLAEAGLVDDAAYARRFAEDRRELRGWGALRIERELERRGVPAAEAAAAAGGRDHGDELHRALELLERRMPAPPADDRERDRAWRLLVRRGYAPELAYEAVRGHERRVASAQAGDYPDTGAAGLAATRPNDEQISVISDTRPAEATPPGAIARTPNELGPTSLEES